MAIIGVTGALLRKRAIRKDGWTMARRARFLDVFAATCNVREASAAAGMSRRNVRALRLRDAGFAQLYDAAIELAQLRLKEELIARSLNGLDSGDNPGPEREQVETPAFDPELAMKVLKLFDGSPGRGGSRLTPAATQQQVDAALMARLAIMARSMNAGAAAAITDARVADDSGSGACTGAL